MRKIILIFTVSLLLIKCAKDTDTILEPENETIVKENIIKIDENNNINIIEVTDDVITLTNNTSDNINVGEILISEFSPNQEFGGFAKKVTSIIEENNLLTIKTEPALLNDIFEQVDLNVNLLEHSNGFTEEINSSNKTTKAFKKTDNTNPYIIEYEVSKILYDADGLETATTNDQIKVVGTLRLEITSFNMKHNKESNNDIPKNNQFSITFEDQSDLNLKIGTSIETRKIYGIDSNNQLSIKYHFNIPVPTPVGIVPLLLPTEISVGFSSELEINSYLDCNLKTNGSMTIGVEYDNGQWSNISKSEFNPKLDINNSLYGVNVLWGVYPIDIKVKVEPYYQDNVELSLGGKLGFENEFKISNIETTNKVDFLIKVYGGVETDFANWLGLDSKFSIEKEILRKNLLNQTTEIENISILGKWYFNKELKNNELIDYTHFCSENPDYFYFSSGNELSGKGEFLQHTEDGCNSSGLYLFNYTLNNSKLDVTYFEYNNAPLNEVTISYYISKITTDKLELSDANGETNFTLTKGN